MKPNVNVGRLNTAPFFMSALFLALLASCGGSDDPVGYVTPTIPAAKSALVPPELTTACPIRDSSIDSLVTKGTGVAFNGATFGAIGTYNYILAEATAKVSAKDPCAATIVDLKNAADTNGVVTYKFDVVMLTPTDATKANGTLLYEVSNRTSSISFAALNDGTSNNLFDNVKPVIPAAATGVVVGLGAGNGFLLNQGSTIIWSGWQGDRPQTLNVATAAISATTKWYAPGMTLPVALDASSANARITGGVQDEFIADNATSNLLGTYYTMAPGALSSATLTVRKTAKSAAVTVDPSLWTYTAGTGVAEGGNTTATGYGFVTINRPGVVANAAYASALDAGSDKGSIYQFNYTAIDPRPFGLGFLGLRDLISYLRYGTKDAAGNANPLAGKVTRTLATGISQSGRYIRDFLWQGFNTDKEFKTVFDGMLPLVGGSRKTYTNYRWAKPGDYSRQHETHYTPGDQFPFGYGTLTDPVTGKTDGLLKKCTQMGNCPKVIQYDSPIEFGGARASLTVTDGAGNDVAIPDNVRMFYAPGTSHGPQSLANNALSQPDYSVDRTVAATAVSASPGALVASTAMYRALLTNLEGWVKGTAAPLASNFPKVSDGTMAVPTTALASLGAPDLSAIGLGYNGVYNDLSVNDESVIPSVASATQFYVVHLPKVDSQSNDKGGVKMPDFAVPLATFKGYSLRRSGFVAGDQNGLGSSQLAFALRTASKNAGDPRKSVEELYGTKASYVASVNTAVDALVSSGLILAADADLYKNRAVMQSLQANFATLP
jgi:Alpha/beta hydrolase domain